MNRRMKLSGLIVVFLLFLLFSNVSAQYAGYSWTTNYQVVNIGAASTDITIRYYDSSGTEVPGSMKQYLDVPVGSPRKVIQLIDDPALGFGAYSAVISADQPLDAIVAQQLILSGSTTYNAVPPFSSYSGAKSGSMKLTLPSVLYNWFGYYTEFYVMNVDANPGSADVDITYKPGSLAGCNTGATGVSDLNNALPQNASLLKNQELESGLGAPSVPGCPAYLTGRFSGTATITSDKPIVAVVNQHAPDVYKLATYNGFDGNFTGTPPFVVLVPQYMRGYFTYYSNIGISNPSASDTAHVDITYTPQGIYNVVSSGVVGPVTVSHDIAPGTTLVRYDGPGATDEQSDLDDAPVYTRFYGAVEVSSDIPVTVLASAESPNIVGSFNGTLATDTTDKISVAEIDADFYGYYTTLVIQNATGTAGSCDITYTSDGVYSLVKNTSKTYTHPLPANGSITVYEGHSGGVSSGDINSDAFWGPPLGRRFLGSASIDCDKNVIAKVDIQTDIPGKDSVYTYNAANR